VSIEAVRRRLVDDYPYYARTVLKVVDRGRVVPFIFRPAQHDLWTLLKAQRDDGQPMRAIILKARKLGFSTFAQGLILQRTTLHPYHISTVIAHNAPTAAAILSVAETMYSHLPEIADAELTLKPPIANRRRQKEIRFGERDRFTGADANQTFGTGQSSLTVDTAREFEGGRGFTFHSIHGSEVGFWPDQKRKLTALRNAVDSTDPNTLILLESTANGHNEFKVMCDMAQAGEGDYPLFFAGWHADPRYRRPLTARQLDRFVIGDESSPFAGEDEAELCERYGLDIEQLHWRRWAIEHLCASDVNIFRQEYPSFPEEAFLATGQTVFGGILIQKALRDTSKAPEPKLIELEQAATMTRKTRRGTVDVPTAVKVTPHGPWEVWAEPSESRSVRDRARSRQRGGRRERRQLRDRRDRPQHAHAGRAVRGHPRSRPRRQAGDARVPVVLASPAPVAGGRAHRRLRPGDHRHPLPRLRVAPDVHQAPHRRPDRHLRRSHRLGHHAGDQGAAP
jgi:hypothetical protein